MNKEHLLTLYFHEGTPQQEEDIKNHVDRCKECQNFLLTLDHTQQSLNQWIDEKPLPGTLDKIMEQVEEKPKNVVFNGSGIPVRPILKIAASIILIILGLFLLKDQITLLPILSDLNESWVGQVFGTFGVTAISFVLLGILVSLAISPVIIMETRTKKYRCYFN
jgi:hypothetical protein